MSSAAKTSASAAYTFPDISDTDVVANRALDPGITLLWPAKYLTGYVCIANNTDEVLFITRNDTDLVSGEMLPPGTSAPFGPLTASEASEMFVYGVGTGDAHLTCRFILSEGF